MNPEIMQLYLIRHAQSENNALWEQTGYSLGRSMDPELTDLGRSQAQYLARFLAKGNPNLDVIDDPHNRLGFGLTHLYSSLMVRAVATGCMIAEALDLPLLGWPDWHEGGGIYLEDETIGDLIGYPGNDHAYFHTHYPNLILPQDVNDGGWWNRPFEERPQRWERARRVLAELMDRHGDSSDRVGVVMHGGFYNYFIKTLLGIEQNQEVWFVMSNAAITRIDFSAEEVRLIYQNRLDFMPSELLSAG
jgi:2,3-bisphosphoglycerate-dependent phosphoglycerate mutase